VTATTADVPAPAIDVSGTPRVPFLRLVGVEARKLTDTRAGRWLIGITLGLLVVVAGIILVVAIADEGFTMSLTEWQNTLAFLTTLLLPTVAIMSLTQEWSQRTGLVTFALEPQRMRVVRAKMVAVGAFAVVTLLFACLVAVVAHGILGTTEDVTWELDGSAIGWTVYLQLAYFAMAFGLALVFLSTPVSIVVYYVVALVLPQIVYGMLYFLLSWGPDVVPWLDLSYAVSQYTGDLPEAPSGTPDLGIAPIAVSFVLWVVVPFVVGLLRVRRIELK
jgi:hypothetical protein